MWNPLRECQHFLRDFRGRLGTLFCLRSFNLLIYRAIDYTYYYMDLDASELAERQRFSRCLIVYITIIYFMAFTLPFVLDRRSVVNAIAESNSVLSTNVPDLDAALDGILASLDDGDWTLATTEIIETVANNAKNTEIVETKTAAAASLVDPAPASHRDCCSCECNYWIRLFGWVCLVVVVAQLVRIAIRYINTMICAIERCN